MADYKELLRRAISALPENNGAARRAVYEKARSALVGQLRSITPPLPAREITQHRLQLEDCIRQVEQEASEAIISLGRENTELTRALEPQRAPEPAATPPPARAVEQPVAEPVTASEPPPAEVSEPEVRPNQREVLQQPPSPPPAPKSLGRKTAVQPTEQAATEPPAAAAAMSIEDIIAQAAASTGTSVEAVEPTQPTEPSAAETRKSEVRAMPSIVTRADPNRSGSISSIPVPLRPVSGSMKPVSIEPRQGSAPIGPRPGAEAPRTAARAEPSLGNRALARQADSTPVAIAPVETALSTVREVEVEAAEPDAHEAQGAIERAIETLDREARGEYGPSLPEQSPAESGSSMFAVPPEQPTEAGEEPGPAVSPEEARSGAGLTIFLVVFAVLLAGAGGAGFWAWREGYVDLDQMFGQAQPVVTDTAAIEPDPQTPTMDPAPSTPVEPVTDVTTGPGNTATTPLAEPANTIENLEGDDRLVPEPVVPDGTETVLPSADGETKTEERLPNSETAIAQADDPAASVDPAVLAGSQSLLLEASANGQSGAVPFSGTVEWSQGTDELGLPTLVGSASIPARNLGVNITIRKNSDPSLPASHLMEVDFDVSDSFIGGTIANLPGVLLKDQELVPGTPLVGASARVVGNSFLFALSASPDDAATNTQLLEDRRWLDLAVVYGTGRNAILTLEKDEDAQELFQEVFASWGS